MGGGGPRVGVDTGTPAWGAGDGCGCNVHLVAPALEYDPEGQVTHELAPVDAWYLPAGQSAQELADAAPVVAQYVPAKQL